MNNILSTISTVLLAASLPLTADVPEMVSYQGSLLDTDGTAYHGTAHFKFLLTNADGTEPIWKNDDREPADTDEPDDHVVVPVNEGLYSLLLGNPAAGMESIDPERISGTELFLRVWVRDSGAAAADPFVQLGPDMRIVSVPYAFRAANVADGSITGASIASGSVTSGKIASGAVTSSKLADQIWLGQAGIEGGASTAGLLNVWSDDPAIGGPGVTLTGSTGVVNAASGFTITDLVALAAKANGGSLLLHDDEGVESVHLAAAAPNGGILELHQQGSLPGLDPWSFPGLVARGAQYGGATGAYLELYQANGTRTGVVIDGHEADGGGAIRVNDPDGNPVVKIDGSDADGYGRVTTQVLEITGGADLAEHFEVSTPAGGIEPGMVVCIDPLRPGELRVSDQANDPAVAGIISGAGGVNPGMLMGQRGSIADGQHPVALTGRVYCWVDADENGPVQPGDLLTTSSTPGHAMRADAKRAAGSILGKAMTALDSGRGLVLVLVNLQ